MRSDGLRQELAEAIREAQEDGEQHCRQLREERERHSTEVNAMQIMHEKLVHEIEASRAELAVAHLQMATQQEAHVATEL